MSRKTGDFLQLLTYINKGKERENHAIFHNLRTDPDDINIIAQEFSENARYSPQRKNGVICYHEILSFSGENFGKNSPEILEDLAREYLQLRAPDALGYAKLHRDTDHPHIHFCISGNQIKQKVKNRLSRAEFGKVKIRLSQYVKAKYPELARQEILFSPASKKKQKARSDKTLTRQPGQTIKAELSQKILGIFAMSKNKTEARSRLSDSGIEIYQRGQSALYGVTYEGKKYRFSTLGIKEKVKDRVEVWQRIEKRLQQLKTIEQAKEKTQEISRDFQ